MEVTAIKTTDIVSIKKKLGVPRELSSCNTGVLTSTGQLVEGHVPANVVHKLLADASVKGVSAPGMPLNAPGMGDLDGNLVTDRKSTRLNSSHVAISYAVFCSQKKK